MLKPSSKPTQYNWSFPDFVMAGLMSWMLVGLFHVMLAPPAPAALLHLALLTATFLGTGVPVAMAVLIYLMVPLAIALLAGGVSLLLSHIKWGKNSWQTAQMLDIGRWVGVLLSLPAWIVMTILLPWSWPVLLAVALVGIPVGVALLGGLAVSLSGETPGGALNKVITLMRWGGPEQSADLLEGLKTDYDQWIFESAVSNGQTAIVEAITQRDKWKSIDMKVKLYACKIAVARNDTKLLGILLDAGVSVNAGYIFSRTSRCLLSYAFELRYWRDGHGYAEIINLLLEQKDVNVNLERGQLPLYWAVKGCDFEGIRELLAGGANPDAQGKYQRYTGEPEYPGASPRDLAIQVDSRYGNNKLEAALDGGSVAEADTKPAVPMAPNPTNVKGQLRRASSLPSDMASFRGSLNTEPVVAPQ